MSRKPSFAELPAYEDLDCWGLRKAWENRPCLGYPSKEWYSPNHPPDEVESKRWMRLTFFTDEDFALVDRAWRSLQLSRNGRDQQLAFITKLYFVDNALRHDVTVEQMVRAYKRKFGLQRVGVRTFHRRMHEAVKTVGHRLRWTDEDCLRMAGGL